MTDPTRIVVAGDTHGNTPWTLELIRQLPELLPDEQPRILLQLGDFGFRPRGRDITRLSAALAVNGGILWFIDGNHDDHTQLAELPTAQNGFGWVDRRIFHLRRGHRWRWHDRAWLALGGAVSLDRIARREGTSWWPEEEITLDQAEAVIQAGRADVMVTHDCPADVRHTFPPPPSWWAPEDLERNDRHRFRLQAVVDAVQPGHLVHGHLHISYQQTVEMWHGRVEVTGLAADGAERGAWAVLNVATMEWETRDDAARA